MKCFGALIMILWLLSQGAQAQDFTSYMGARIHHGSILIHSRSLRPIQNSYPTGIELEFGKHKTSQKVWNNCHCYPKVGFALSYWNFDNPGVLGYGISSLAFIQPVFNTGQKLSFSVRAGMGISYQSKPYNEITNPYNLSYSTPIAVPLQLGGALHYKMNNRWLLELNLVYNHLSNGGMKLPNKGINWPTLGLGISRYFQSPRFPNHKKTNWRNDEIRKQRTDLLIFGTFHQPSARAYLLSGGLEIKHARRLARLNNLIFGAEWMHDSNQYRKSNKFNRASAQNLGVFIGHEFILGRFLFGQQFAVYLFNPIIRREDFFQRYFLVFRITDQISTGISLKTHLHVADFGDLRIGYSF